MRLLLLTGLLAAMFPSFSVAEEKKEEKPVDLPVKTKLVAKKTTYTLDLGGKTGEEFRKQLKDAEKNGRMPAAPTVDLTLEITNTSDKAIKIWTSGDPVHLELTLTGPGAVMASPRLAFTTDFRGPAATVLDPGKTLSIPVTKLQYGFRGASLMSYWTEPGEYKLAATYKTAIQPPPKGTKLYEGFGQVNLTFEPITLKIEAAK